MQNTAIPQIMNLKVCNLCSQPKPYDEFPFTANLSARRDICQECSFWQLAYWKDHYSSILGSLNPNPKWQYTQLRAFHEEDQSEGVTAIQQGIGRIGCVKHVSHLHDYLGFLGEMGWELVSVVWWDQETEAYYFKRRMY